MAAAKGHWPACGLARVPLGRGPTESCRLLAPSTIRPRVLIADDHSIVADGLRSVLEKSCDVIGIVQDGRELLTEAPKLKPDVIVLDIGAPFLNGLDAAERLKPLLPKAKFVFLTMKDDPNLAVSALNSAAADTFSSTRRSRSY